MYLIIDKQRVLSEIADYKRNNDRTSLDWFMSHDSVLHIFIHKHTVKYIYREWIQSKDELHPQIHEVMTSTRRLEGVALNEDLFPVQEEQDLLPLVEFTPSNQRGVLK